MIPSILVLIATFKDWSSNKKITGKSAEENEVSVNIISSEVRCYQEWIDYGIKLDFELFFNKKVLIKSLKLNYKEPFGFGENWKERAELYYVPLEQDDLLKQDLPQFMESLKTKEIIKEFPLTFEEKSILQVTLCGYIAGERLSDGWEGISLNNWTLVIEYNENQTIEVPITLQAHNNSEKRATEWKYVGFVNA